MSSVTEIEAAIKKLAPDDFSKIVYRIHLLEAQFKKTQKPQKPQKPQKKDFNEAMGKVFEHHALLLKELAR
jgi:hypothetical protein